MSGTNCWPSVSEIIRKIFSSLIWLRNVWHSFGSLNVLTKLTILLTTGYMFLLYYLFSSRFTRGSNYEFVMFRWHLMSCFRLLSMGVMRREKVHFCFFTYDSVEWHIFLLLKRGEWNYEIAKKPFEFICYNRMKNKKFIKVFKSFFKNDPLIYC